MSAHLNIAPARSERDWAAASTLLAGYLDWVSANVSEPLPAPTWAAIESDVRRPAVAFSAPGRLHVARLARLPVGVLGAVERGDHVELTRFFVRPVARGTGCAERLLASVLDALDDDGVARVELETLPAEMRAAHRLYRRHGFVEVGRSPLCPSAVRMRRWRSALADSA